MSAVWDYEEDAWQDTNRNPNERVRDYARPLKLLRVLLASSDCGTGGIACWTGTSNGHPARCERGSRISAWRHIVPDEIPLLSSARRSHPKVSLREAGRGEG